MKVVNPRFVRAAALLSCGVVLAADIAVREPLPAALAGRIPSDKSVLLVPESEKAEVVRTIRRQLADYGLEVVGIGSSDSKRALIVDSSRIVRYARSFGSSDDMTVSLVADARQWLTGRDAFSTNCGHCHGDDGADTSYPNVKTLKGIAIRMNDQKIMEGASQFGAVDTSAWTHRERDALLLFIREL